MTDDDVISDLLDRWESAWHSGIDIDIKTLCSDYPALTDRVTQRVAVLKAMNRVLDLHPSTDEKNSRDGNTWPESTSHHSDREIATISTMSDYRVIRSHARGGLGEVLVAFDSQLSREVALKVIQAPYDRDPNRCKRFLREAEITSRLEHPGIVPVHGVGQDAQGRPCYTMRFIHGDTLQAEIEKYHSRRHELSAAEHARALRSLLQRFVSVCNTVGYAHSRGIIHRDIKPSNIILGGFSETLVVDWGIAKDINQSHRYQETVGNCAETLTLEQPSSSSHSKTDELLTRQGGILGTPAFMSPEQASATALLEPTSDIYSLGATLYVILTGQPPAKGENIAHVLDQVRSGKITPARQIVRSIPAPLEAICTKAMQIAPTARYQSALELSHDVEHWLSDEPVSVFSENILDRSLRWIRRHRTITATTTAASLIILLSLVIQIILISQSNENLLAANQRATTAKNEAVTQSHLAESSAKLADEQSALALSILQEVIQDVQRDLRNTPTAQPVRKAILQKSMEGLSKVSANIEKRPQIDRNLMLAYRDLGDVYLMIGSDAGMNGSQEAHRHFLSALQLAEKLASENSNDRQARIDLSTVLSRLSSTASQISTAKESEDYLLSDLALCEKLVVEFPDDVESKFRLINVRNLLGDYYVKNRSLDQAAISYDVSLNTVNEMVASNIQHADLIRNREIALNNVGAIRIRQGRFAEALESYSVSLASARNRFDKSPDDPKVQFELAFVLNSMSDAHKSNGEFALAEPFCREAHQILEKRFQNDPTNLVVQREMMRGQEKLGDLLLKLNKVNEAEQQYRGMLLTCQKLSAIDPQNRSALRDLSIAYHRMGSVLWEQKQHDFAVEFFQKALQSDRERQQLDDADPRAKTDVAIALSNLATIFLELERANEAIPMLEESVAIYRRASTANPSDARSRRNLFVLLSQLGAALRRNRLYDRSRECNDESLEMATTMVGKDIKNAALRLDLVSVLNARGVLENADEKYTEAISWFNKALEIIAELEQENLLVGRDVEWRTDIESQIESCKADEAKKNSSK
jgi:eukaryotic-like serine/threonine-protein kinase